jgi:protocatechuate 3,4-dioxygenase beta subunit
MPKTQGRFIASWVWYAGALVASTVFAQQPPASPSDTPARSTLAGVVRDPAGQLSAKATVWLVVRRGGVFDPPVKTECDENGRFTFADVDEKGLFTSGRSVAIAARDAAGRLGWHNLRRSNRERRLHEIRLRETASLTGSVVDGDGRPLAGARLTPKSFHEPRTEGAAFTGDESISLWPELAAEYSTLAAADGAFEIAGVPRAILARCQIGADRVEKAEVVIESGIAATVRLGESGSIAGQLTSQDADLPVEGFQLRISSETDTKQPQEPSLRFADVATVDEEGRFRFEGLPPGRYSIRPVESQNVPFLAEPTTPLTLKSGQHLDGLVIPLTSCREVKGRVVDRRTGQGIGSVQVYLSSGEAGSTRPAQSVQSDAEGAFSAWLPPGKATAHVRRVPTEYLLPSYTAGGNGMPIFGEQPLIELDRAAAVEGVVVDEAGNPVPVAWLDIQRSSIPRIGPWQRPPAQADASGNFIVPQLEPHEPLVIRARSSTATTDGPITVIPAELDGPVRLVVSEKNACRFSGQVVDRRGNPLPAAKVSIANSRQIPTTFPARGFLRQLNLLESVLQVAADGTFETEALFPGDSYQLTVTSPGHGDRLFESVRGEPGRLHDFGPIALDAFASFTGQVVDAAGKAVPNAELRIVLPDGSPQEGTGIAELRSDDAGRFGLPPVNVGGVLRIWARAGELTTDGAASFFPDLIDGPLKVELAEKRGFRVAGQVVDVDGRPLHASVAVVWQLERTAGRRSVVRVRGLTRAALTGGPVSLGSNVAGDDGRFLAEGLWPDQLYHLVVTADGYATLESAVFSGAADVTADAGRMVLLRSNLAVEGQVVDASGQPVVGATVFNSGDAQQPLTVETDAAGRFRLTGLLEGPAYFLIRKPGYWPAGLRCRAGEVGQKVRLTEDKQPRPESRLAPPPEERPSPEDRALARRLLHDLWQTCNEYALRKASSSRGSRSSRSNNGLQVDAVIRHMASLDYHQALKWSAAVGEAFDETIRIRAFEQIVHDDLNLAIAQAEAPGASYALRWMAKRRLAAGERDDALRLLKAALHANLRTETLFPEPHADVVARAEIGMLAIAAGRDEWGRQLVNEAADQVERLGGEADSKTRAVVAAALAVYDSPRSVRIWEMLPEPEGGMSGQHLTELAVSVGVHDLKAARRIAAWQSSSPGGGGIGFPGPGIGFQAPSNGFDPVLVRIARRLAMSHPERALTLLEEVADEQRLEKAEALARVAMGLAPHDAQRAFGLIDQALGMCLTPPDAARRNAAGNRAETAARIALMAAEAGYPDMQTVVDQVLALRLTPVEEASTASRRPDRATQLEATVDVAWVLAIIDPGLARSLLDRLPPPESTTDSSDGIRIIARWLQAWAMVDPQHAAALFHRVLDEQGRSITMEWISHGLLPIVDALLWSHEDRINQVLQRHPSSWLEPPGTED